MSKNILIDNSCGSIIAALVKDDKLLEYHIEKSNRQVVVGSIYKGRVENVLEGMQAAFVNIGLEKNGYLFADDMLFDKKELDVDIPTTLNLKIGDEIMVQATKEPSGTKGVRLTSFVSFAGRYLVYTPNFDTVAVSRKITDEKKRDKITKIIKSFKLKGGFIVRTAGEFALKKDLKDEAVYLSKLYEEVKSKFCLSKPCQSVYNEGNLAVRMLRDVYTSEIEKIYVADKNLHEQVVKSVEKRGREVLDKIVLFNERQDLFKTFNLDKEVEKLLHNRVDLSNGGYIVIDKTEALTSIDVNTGSYTGNSASLEQTVFETNVIATEEIARQVRLRNIGGIVIVDFIDMESQEHRDTIVKLLTEQLKNDRAKCNVVGINQLGLVEFTRKKKRKESISLMVKNCPYCQGEGTIFSNDYIVHKIRSALFDVFSQGYSSAIIDLNIEIMSYIQLRGLLSKDVNRIWANKRVYLIPHKTYHQHYFTVKGDNSLVLELPDKAQLIF